MHALQGTHRELISWSLQGGPGYRGNVKHKKVRNLRVMSSGLGWLDPTL